MPTRSHGNPDGPPSPGGDLDQPDNNVAVPPARNAREIKDNEKTVFGHTGSREEVPAPKGAPNASNLLKLC